MGIIKKSYEIKMLKKAASISNSCIPIIHKSLKEEGITEKEISKRIKENIYKKGGKLSFRTLVASGIRSSMIHPKPTVTSEKINGIGYVDFGASYKGYKVDLTIPFIKGKVNNKTKKIVDFVNSLYYKIIKKWKYGLPCYILHKFTDDIILSKKLYMGHSLGHGIGLRIHERPIIGMPRNNLTGKNLKKWEKIKKIYFVSNMAFTIEPGVYVKNIGGCRIENSFYISNRKLIPLTKAKLIKVK